jgi:phosphatidylglycerol:prolipoprotein diacylglycerol transferase
LAHRLELPFARLLGPLVLGGSACGAVVRVGCFFAGCCHGAPTGVPWAVVYPDVSAAAHAFGSGVAVHPSPLYEAALLLAIAGFLAFRERLPRPDRVQVLDAALAVVLYLAGRFALDFTRGDAVRHAGLATTQWLALGLLILGAVAAFRESFAAADSPGGPRCIVE